MCSSLAGFHAFTGCDYAPSFVGRGKKRQFTLLLNNENAQEAFGMLGDTEIVSETCVNGLEKFECQMYGNKSATSINNVLLDKFLTVYKPKKNAKKMLSSIKGVDGSSFPPCFEILIQQIQRANYICSLWRHASTPDFGNFSPHRSGWIMQDDFNGIKWFHGDQYPSDLEILIEDDGDATEDGEYDYISSDDSDSDVDENGDDFNGCFIY